MIETERLVLRRWRTGDIDPFHAMALDPEVMRFLPPMTRDDCARYGERMNALAEESGDCFWAVETRGDGRFIGLCGIKPGLAGTPIAGEAELGWRLAREAWGKGLAREAASACIDRARAGEERDRIFAITVPANDRSWGLMERLGMTRVAGGDFDHPAVRLSSPLRRHITYRIDRPA